MEFLAILERADDGSLSVWVPDLPGCVSCGDTQEEALRMIRDAIEGHLAVLREHGDPVPPPRSVAAVIRAA